MTGKTKTRSGEATPKRAQAGAGLSRSSTSTNYSTTSAAGRQIQIAGFLLKGAENAVPRRHLRQLVGLPDRELRRRIQEERLSGVPILSDSKSGYYLPANDGERARFIRSMRGRAQEIEAVAAAVEGAEIG